MAVVTIWTQADITALKAAMSQGIFMVSYAGPPMRSVQYQSLKEMRALLAEMVSQVNGVRRSRTVIWDKGFY